jgi:Tfp pilus assembly protein PilO
VNVNRRAVVLGALAAVGVVALWWVFVFSPKGNDLNDARDDLDRAKRQTQTLNAQLKQLEDLQERSPQTEAELGRLSAAIPAQPNQADFLSGLNDIADQSGITWQSVTMQEPTDATPGLPPTIAVQISIEGGFFQALDYINRLEDLERLVVVDSVTINSSDSSAANSGGAAAGPGSGLTTSGSGELSVSLNARIFSQTTLDTAPSGTTPSGSTNGGSSDPNNGVTS